MRYGGAMMRGFGIGAVGVPATLTSDQQGWVLGALATLREQISTNCTGWQDPTTNLSAAVGCFQTWYSAHGGFAAADGVLDVGTLCQLIGTMATRTAYFPHLFPDPQPDCQGWAAHPNAAGPLPVPVPPTPPPKEDKKLSTGAMVGIAAVGAAAFGGIIYAATSGGKRSRKSRRRS